MHKLVGITSAWDTHEAPVYVKVEPCLPFLLEELMEDKVQGREIPYNPEDWILELGSLYL